MKTAHVLFQIFFQKILIITLMMISQDSYAYLRRQMYTLSPNIQINGPLLSSLGQRTQYSSEIFRLIIEEADKIARPYAQLNDTKAYWSFLILALTVPLHEGDYVHFYQAASGNSCQTRSNSGEILSHSQPTRNVFTKEFKSQAFPIFPECHVFSVNSPIRQILHGHDGTDLGIMQVNIRWHEAKYISKGLYKDTRESIRYGLELLYSGFNRAYRNSQNYPCLKSVNIDDPVHYEALIRGSWSGIYNTGNMSGTCRFADESSSWRRNDQNFMSSLNKILNYNAKVATNNPLSLDETSSQTLVSIVHAYKTGAQSLSIVDQFLRTDNLNSLNQPVSNTPMRMSVNAQMLNTRHLPDLDKGEVCGVLSQGTNIFVHSIQNGFAAIDASQIDIEMYEKCQDQATIYASTRFLTPVISERIAYTTTQLRIRASAPQDGRLGEDTSMRLSAGEMIRIVSEYKIDADNIWYQISTPSAGWISGKFIEFETGEQ